MRSCLTASGVVCHNLHTGNADLDSRLVDASAAYAAAFPSACVLPSRRRGNAIVGASMRHGAFESLGALQAAARRQRERCGLLFDASARLEGLDVVG